MWKGSSGSKYWAFHRLVAASVGVACLRLPRWPRLKNPPASAEDVRDLGWEDSLEKGMAIHSSILGWRMPWTEEAGGLQSRGLQRVGLDRATEYAL